MSLGFQVNVNVVSDPDIFDTVPFKQVSNVGIDVCVLLNVAVTVLFTLS